MQKAIEEAKKIENAFAFSEETCLCCAHNKEIIERLETIQQDDRYNQGCIDTLETHIHYANPALEMQKSLDFLYSNNS